MTATSRPHEPNRLTHTISVPWTSDASGDFTESVTINGFLYGAWTTPSGSAAPSNLYDLTVVAVAAGGKDLLGGNGADRSDTNTEFAQADPYPVPINGEVVGGCVVTIANAGNAKSGTVYLEVESR